MGCRRLIARDASANCGAGKGVLSAAAIASAHQTDKMGELWQARFYPGQPLMTS